MSACAGPSYYAQAVDGHFDLLRERQPVKKLLQSDDTPDELARDLALSVEIRQFAAERLGLPDNGSYADYVHTGRTAVAWNVVAAPELSLEPRRWCFLFAGCVPYRGYFEREDARGFADRLAAKGLDVSVSPAVAYSTLGWFRDPLLDTMLRQGEERLAGLIFHELAHQNLYLAGDAAFNESYASFVEEVGVALWLKASGRGERLPRWERRIAAGRDFDDLLRNARRQLAALYASQTSEAAKRDGKRATFEALQTGYRSLIDSRWEGRDYYGGWFSQEVNNARLALVDSYRGGRCAFASLYVQADRNFTRFQQLAVEKSRLSKTARREWLRSDCPHVAPDEKL
jgi:predicted aminopeptidase